MTGVQTCALPIYKALAAIAKLTPRPVQFVVNTSAHADHTGGNVKFRAAGQDPSLFGSFFSAGRPDAGQGATMIAHQNVQNFMIADNSSTNPMTQTTDRSRFKARLVWWQSNQRFIP